MIFNFSNPEKAIKMAIKLIEENKSKEFWQDQAKEIINDKLDLTSFIIWFVENYPNSLGIIRDNPNYQYKFR